MQGPSYAVKYTYKFAKMVLPDLLRARTHQFPGAQGRKPTMQWADLPWTQETAEKKQGYYLVHLPGTLESRQRKPKGNPISQLPWALWSPEGVWPSPEGVWPHKTGGGGGWKGREQMGRWPERRQLLLLYKRYEPPLVPLIDFLLYCFLKRKA